MSLFEALYLISIILLYNSNWSICLSVNISLICINTSKKLKKKITRKKKIKTNNQNVSLTHSVLRQAARDYYFFNTKT